MANKEETQVINEGKGRPKKKCFCILNKGNKTYKFEGSKTNKEISSEDIILAPNQDYVTDNEKLASHMLLSWYMTDITKDIISKYKKLFN